MPLTEQGYHRPTYNEILERKIQTAKELFGEDIETSEQTALGKFIRIGAYDLAKAYEDLEATYYARFPNTATGVSLDRLCVFAGISRNPATFAKRTITVKGEPDTEVDEINVCGENGEITFHNIQAFTIPADGAVDIIVECDTAGTVGNVYDIDKIVNPIVGVDSIEYKGSIDDIDGEDRESDFDLRNRFSQIIEGLGASNANSIRASLLKLPTVKSVSIIENNEDTYQYICDYCGTPNIHDKLTGSDIIVCSKCELSTITATSRNRPPHTFECYVYGGDDEDSEDKIAQIIYEKKPLGITACSTSETPVYKTIIDESGAQHTIEFSHTESILVSVVYQLTKNDKFEEDGETQLKTAIVEYINNLGVGVDVFSSPLYQVAYNNVAGINDIFIGVSSEYATSDCEGVTKIGIEPWQVAHTDLKHVWNATELVEVTNETI